MLPDFELIQKGKYEPFLRENDIHSFHQLTDFIAKLPYGRTTNRTNFLEVFELKKGTCSSKHAILSDLCELNHHAEIELMVGVFLMDSSYNLKIKPVLEKYSLAFIPEAHCYLRYQGKRYDFTTKNSHASSFEYKLVREQRCDSNQVIDWKPMIHQHFISSWIKRNSIPYSESELWEIREECIKSLNVEN